MHAVGCFLPTLNAFTTMEVETGEEEEKGWLGLDPSSRECYLNSYFSFQHLAFGAFWLQVV